MEGVPPLNLLSGAHAAQKPRLPPVFALGFRPFFLAGAVLSVLWLPAWLLVYGGVLAPVGPSAPSVWHGHEMVFGFTGAIIAGFLLTAARNWTGRPTVEGLSLAVLVVVWMAGRAVLLFGPGMPTLLRLLVDVAFLPLVAIALAIPIVRARNWRNLGFLPILAALTCANVIFHLGAAGTLPGIEQAALGFAVKLIAVIMVLVGGRVIPFFTRNALEAPDIGASTRLGWVAMGATLLLLVLELFPLPRQLIAAVALAAGTANLVRMRGWGTARALRVPMLWVLHAGYAWIGVGFLLEGLAHLGLVMPTVGLHALTAGAIGTLTLGMMARVSLGHTGRPIVARRPMAFAFGLVIAAGLLRTAGPIAAGDFYLEVMVVSGVLWSAAFGIFLVLYAPILVRPRADGRPG